MSLRSKLLPLLAALPLAVLSTHALAQTPPPVALDGIGDFLSTYTGPRSGDLDVVTAMTFYDASRQTFAFNATMAGEVGSDPDAVYVWGLNRGAGFATFATLAPGVRFDGVLVVALQGMQGFIDLASGSFTPLAADAVRVAGHSLEVSLAASVMAPTQFAGVAPAQYTWNLWPRHTFNPADESTISDFAPDNSNLGMLAVSAVPEPATWLSLALGLSLLAGTARRRARRADEAAS